MSLDSLVWGVSVEHRSPAVFGAQIDSVQDLEPFETRLAQLGLTVERFQSERGRALIRNPRSFKDTPGDVLVVVDALHEPLAALANLQREVLLGLGRPIVFAETRPPGPGAAESAPDLSAVMRDVVDLRGDPGVDDHLLDGGSSFDKIVGGLPKVETRGSTLILRGEVHRKAPRQYACPECGKPTARATVSMEFRSAPNPTQHVSGLRCELGHEFPDPSAVREAHRAAHGQTPRSP